MIRIIKFLIFGLSVVFLAGCAAGNPDFTFQDPAGFFYGIWHGVISFITLFVHLFNDNVRVYEMNNTGGWYDFGFLLGVTSIWGGGCHFSCKTAADKKRDKEWEQIGEKVENKIMRKLKQWAEEEGDSEPDAEWKDIGDKVEIKLKRKIREWAEKE